MATVCELSADFEEPITFLYEMFRHNIHTAIQWGTGWEIIREEAIRRADGATVRFAWGFSAGDRSASS